MECKRNFTTIEGDWIAANRLHAKQLWNRRATLRGGLFFSAAAGLLGFSIFRSAGWYLLLIPGAAVAYMLVGYFVAQLAFSRAARRSFHQSKAFLRPTEIEWDAKNVRLTSERGTVQDAWVDFFAWAADDRSVLLYQSANAFITLPVRDLGLDAQRSIVDALRKSGIKERRAS